MNNTHGSTHTLFQIEVEEIFKVSRDGEEERFKELHNRKLLWHGSRLTNFAGILSQGLRIAPKEAPANGYMFGKGVYFADMVSKSAGYSIGSSNIGLMLLCEVSLGNVYEKTSAEYIEELPEKYHSTKGLGNTAPDENESIFTDGVEIPLGKAKMQNVQSALLYNEYIVYEEAQVKMKYLLKVKFNS